MRLQSIATLILVSALTVGCAGVTASRPAREGNYEQMRAAIQDDLRHGRLSFGATQDLAYTVSKREIKVAKDAEAVRHIRLMKSCTRELSGPFEQRAGGSDRAAPIAAMALLNVDRGSPGKWRSRLDSTDPDWRAVSVRTLTSKSDGENRRKAMVDHDQQVRMAAMLAAEKAKDPADRPVLLDAARHDPDGVIRVTAIRALARVATADDVSAMRDMWALATPQVQQWLVASWGFPNALEHGGGRYVLWVAETQTGLPSIIAGGILMRIGGEMRGYGSAALFAGAQDGLATNRVLAIGMAPLQEEGWMELINKLSQEAEPVVRVAALEKLVTHPKTREQAKEKLHESAKSKGPESAEAKQAMARVGDRRVTGLLDVDAKSKDAAVRQATMRSFVALGDYARASVFLADPVVTVRLNTACTLLLAGSR